FVLARVEFHESAYMRTHELGLARLEAFRGLGFRRAAPATSATGRPGPDAKGRERAVELDYEITAIAVVFRHAAAVIAADPDDLVFPRNDLHRTVAGRSNVKHHI